MDNVINLIRRIEERRQKGKLTEKQFIHLHCLIKHEREILGHENPARSRPSNRFELFSFLYPLKPNNGLDDGA